MVRSGSGFRDRFIRGKKIFRDNRRSRRPLRPVFNSKRNYLWRALRCSTVLYFFRVDSGKWPSSDSVAPALELYSFYLHVLWRPSRNKRSFLRDYSNFGQTRLQNLSFFWRVLVRSFFFCFCSRKTLKHYPVLWPYWKKSF